VATAPGSVVISLRKIAKNVFSLVELECHYFASESQKSACTTITGKV
jgi:hypothetical protein